MTAQGTERQSLDVLLVEDNPGDARLFEELLGESELEADHRWEPSLEQGMAAARDAPPTVIVVDLGLPDSQGPETVARITETLPDVPVVVLTGQTGLDAATEALDAGASEYLRKDGLTTALLARTLRLAVERHRLEREAAEHRALSRSILESLPEHIAVLDSTGEIVATNESWRSFAASEGGDPRGYVGENYLEETEAAAENGSTDAVQMLEGLRGVLEGDRDRFELEYPCHGPEERRWFRVEVVPHRGKDTGGVVVSHVDVTERKLAEEEVRERGRRFESLVSNISDVISVVESDGTVDYVSPSVKRVLGYDPDELEGSPFFEPIHPDDRDRLAHELERLLSSPDEQRTAEARYRHADGSWRVLETRGRVPPPEANLSGVIVISRDVTERVRRERELERATGSLRERVKEQSCLYDISQLLHADPRDLERRLREVVHRLPEAWQHPDVTAARLELADDSWSSAGFDETDWMLSAPVTVGSERAGLVEIAYLEERRREDIGPFLEEEEKLLAAVADQIGVAVERHRTRRELDSERRRLTEVFENAPAWVATLRGPEHVFEMANSAYYDLVGDRELVGRPVREVLPELEGQGYFEMLDHIYETGEAVEVEEEAIQLETDHGTETKYVTFVYQPRREDGEIAGVIAHGIDVTEQVEKREEAREAEERWATALDLAPVGIAISDPKTAEYYSVNQAVAEMLGLEAADMVGRTAHEIGFWHDPGRRDEFLSELRDRGAVRNELMRFETASGKIRHGRLSVKALELAGENRLIWTLQDVTEERRVRERLFLLESAVEATDHGVVITDRGGSIAWANPAFEAMTGYSREEVLGENPRILRSGEQGEAFYEELWDTIVAGESWDGELVNQRKDGTRYVEQQHIVPVRHRSDEITHFIAIKQDVTERRERQEALRESEARYRTLVETMAEATVILDREGRITFANAAAEELLGLERSETEARTYNDPGWRITAPDGGAFPDHRLPFQRVMRTGRPVRNVEHAIERTDGERRILAVNAAPLGDGPDEPDGVVATIRDVTERKQMEDELRHQALHDGLTGAANRSLFRDRLEQDLSRAGRQHEPLGLVIIDLDRFKQVNDHLGHTAGDRLLEEVTRRMTDVVRDTDTVARLGGDEFAVIVPEVGGEEGLRRVVDRLLASLTRPFHVGGTPVEIDVTAGGVLTDSRETVTTVETRNPEDLVRYADLALYRAKEASGSSFHLFHPEDDRDQTELLGREQELRRAIRRGEFEIHFQPIVRLEDGSVWGVEPLARWNHPGRGMLSPGEFIPLAEETGLIHDLGEQLIEEACRHAASWPEGTGGSLVISPNLSGRQFDREDLVPTLVSAVDSSGLAPSRFEFEITESAITRATGKIEQLRSHGFGILVDDFGTGYSSFHYLRDLDLDGLKIDMSFIQGLDGNEKGRGLVETMITLGRSMAMTVVAEGIETEEQQEILRELGCPLGQGFLFARPMAGDEIPDFLEAFSGP